MLRGDVLELPCGELLRVGAIDRADERGQQLAVSQRDRGGFHPGHQLPAGIGDKSASAYALPVPSHLILGCFPH